MSSNPNPVQNISDVVAPADLNTWAGIAGVLRYLTEPIETPGGALGPSSMAVGVMSNAYLNTYAALRNAGVDHVPAIRHSSWWATILGLIGDIAAAIGQLAGLLAELIFKLLAEIWGGFRKGIDFGASELAAVALGEMFLEEVNPGLLRAGLSPSDHLARAQELGAIVQRTLIGEFKPALNGAAVPSLEPAQTLSGIMVNSGIASALMGMIGGMVPWLHEEEMHSLLQAVVQNLGLGRLCRRALTPIIQIMVAKPMEWALNTQFTPTQFSLSELINPYAQNAIPHDQIFTAMNLLGYSNDKIQAIIELHQKRFNPGEVKALLDYGLWDQPTADDYILKLNWPAAIAGNVLILEELREERSWTDKLIAELETEVKNRNITLDEFTTVVNGLPYSARVKQTILATAQYKYNAHVGHVKVSHLSYAQIKQAFENGLLTMTQITDRWTAQGYSLDDQDVLELLLLLDLQKTEAAAAAKAAKAAKKTTTSTTTGKVTG